MNEWASKLDNSANSSHWRKISHAHDLEQDTLPRAQRGLAALSTALDAAHSAYAAYTAARDAAADACAYETYVDLKAQQEEAFRKLISSEKP